ncbi:MAG: hypothetical protein M3350_03610, partial [Actinomycetota bacterium]|nr:hypothetical protein [Actinomycetota bacterium]
MPWVESDSLSFSARHESSQADEAALLLDDLEAFRSQLGRLYRSTPGEVTVVIHPRPAMLALAHPWLPLARRLSAPAARRYYAGWFSEGEIHVLAPSALRARSSGGEGSHEALMLSPRHEYAHLVVGSHNSGLPPPFRPRSFARYLSLAWLAEGAATWLAGQVPHLRAAIARRLREGSPPSFPPAPSDALILGGTVFALLEEEAGPRAAAALAAAAPAQP